MWLLFDVILGDFIKFHSAQNIKKNKNDESGVAEPLFLCLLFLLNAVCKVTGCVFSPVLIISPFLSYTLEFRQIDIKLE